MAKVVLLHPYPLSIPMPALLVLESEFIEDLIKYLVESCGYQRSMEGFSPSEGVPGVIHWPALADLPVNMLYHPERCATDSYREVARFATANSYPLNKAVAFNVNPEWSGMISRYDNDKPSVPWEDFSEK